ncbi:DNA-binding protein YbiB, partial [Corallococcus coralloides]|nr:DNA-binding protein YbiB [Corallococcus coralloides]
HSVVKLMNPVRGPSLLVTAYTHPEYQEMLHATFAARGMDVLLSRGLEGEVAADPRRTPRYDAFVRGAHHEWDEQQPGSASGVPGLPADIGVEATARYTQQVLAGELPVPAPLSRQVEHILRLARQTTPETAP